MRTAEDVPNAAFQSRRDSDSAAATANVLGTKDSRVGQRFGMTPDGRRTGGSVEPSAVQVPAGTLYPPGDAGPVGEPEPGAWVTCVRLTAFHIDG